MTTTVESASSVLKKLYPDGEITLRLRMAYTLMWVETYIWSVDGLTYHQRSTLAEGLNGAFKLACKRNDRSFNAEDWIRKRGFQYGGLDYFV